MKIMIIKNKKMTSKMTTIMIATIAISAFSLIGSEAYATNSYSWKWADVSQDYFCTSSLTTITKTSHVSPCSNLTTSSNVWEGISGSTWSLTETASSGTPVYAWTSGVSGAGLTVITINNGVPIGAYIAMNKNLSWEDSAQDTSTNGYDWRSATGHEFGHLANMKHSTNTISVMYGSIAENQVRRSPDTHDDSMMAANY